MRIFITGASGLVGSRVVSKLLSQHEIVAVSRNISRLAIFDGIECIEGDVTREGAWQDIARTCDAIVHLAGAGIMDRRWSNSYKEVLRKSRVDSTRHCAEVGVDVLIAASATGIYGNRGDEELTEASSHGVDFLSMLAVDWEAAANDSASRIVTLRFGMVLDPKGGAVKKMKFPFQLGLGGKIGNGKQYWPWIHYEDVCNIIDKALNEKWEGAFNAVAPEQVTCKEFAKSFGLALNRPSIVPMPDTAIRVLLGEASCVLTASQRVIPERLQEYDFEWTFASLDTALQNVVMPID